MKKFIKAIIICSLALGIGWYIFTQTQWGQDYADQNIPRDMSSLRYTILDMLNATGVVMTGTQISTGLQIEYTDTGAIVVDQAVLDQRLQYYRDAKDILRAE